MVAAGWIDTINDLNQRFAELTAPRGIMPLDRRIQIYGMLLAMVGDGLPLDAALRELHERSTERKRPIAPIIRRWVANISAGMTFAESIKKEVPSNELVLISSGERANDLVTGLQQAIVICRAQRDMKSALWSNMTMPAVLLIMFFAIVINFSLYMAPELAKVAPPSVWPGSGKQLYDISVVVAAWWKLIVIVSIMTSVAITVSLSRWTGSLRSRFDRMPPWSIYQNYTSAGFMISLSSLLRSGVPLEGALRYIKAHANRWVSDHISVMQSRIRSGEDYGRALNTGLLDDSTTDEVIIYSRVAEFDKAIMSVGGRAIDRGIEKIKIQSAVARNLTLILVAIAVGWIYYTVFSMNSVVAKMAKPGASATQQR